MMENGIVTIGILGIVTTILSIIILMSNTKIQTVTGTVLSVDCFTLETQKTVCKVTFEYTLNNTTYTSTDVLREGSATPAVDDGVTVYVVARTPTQARIHPSIMYPTWFGIAMSVVGMCLFVGAMFAWILVSPTESYNVNGRAVMVYVLTAINVIVLIYVIIALNTYRRTQWVSALSAPELSPASAPSPQTLQNLTSKSMTFLDLAEFKDLDPQVARMYQLLVVEQIIPAFIYMLNKVIEKSELDVFLQDNEEVIVQEVAKALQKVKKDFDDDFDKVSPEVVKSQLESIFTKVVDSANAGVI